MDSMDMYLDRTFLYSQQRHLFKKNMGAIIESEHLWFCSKFTRIPGRSPKEVTQVSTNITNKQKQCEESDYISLSKCPLCYV